MNAVVIPCYKEKSNIAEILYKIDSEIDKIYVIDDNCPENTGKYVENKIDLDRVEVLYHKINKGIGGAVKTGYKKAIKDNADIIIKIDGDGQMDPKLIPYFISNIKSHNADYVKGNRFYFLNHLKTMPLIRKIGNSILSFLGKIVSGYWNIMDPTNGYTAINTKVLKLIPLNKLDDGAFFENDLLFRLNILNARVKDIPVSVKYNNIDSSLNIFEIAIKFPFKYLNRFIKRLFYNYFLRDFNLGSFELIFGILFLLFGGIFGSIHWLKSIKTGVPATTGTVIISAIPVILGIQFLLAFLQFDVQNIPNRTLSSKLNITDY